MLKPMLTKSRDEQECLESNQRMSTCRKLETEWAIRTGIKGMIIDLLLTTKAKSLVRLITELRCTHTVPYSPSVKSENEYRVTPKGNFMVIQSLTLVPKPPSLSAYEEQYVNKALYQ